MNDTHDSPEMLERRALLRRAAYLLGGAISAPAALAILQGCSAKDAPAAADWKPRLFTGNETAVVSAIADIFIPKTDTSGALDAGVPVFIDSVLADVYGADAQERFHTGCKEFEDTAKAGGKAFLDQDAAMRTATVKRSLEAALAGEHEHRPFILLARELTLLGFFSSKAGITENMQYEAVPTVYHGCVPVSQMKKPVYWE